MAAEKQGIWSSVNTTAKTLTKEDLKAAFDKFKNMTPAGLDWQPGHEPSHGDWQWASHPEKGIVWNKPGTDVILKADDIVKKMHEGGNFKDAVEMLLAEATAPKPAFDGNQWSTDYDSSFYYCKPHPHVHVSHLRISQIKHEQKIVSTINAIRWWYENEYEWTAAPPQRWVWTDKGWAELPWNTSPYKAGGVTIGKEYKIVEGEKPTGLPKTGMNIKSLRFVDVDRPVFEQAWAWAPYGGANKGKCRWFSIYQGQFPTQYLQGVKGVVIGRKKAPQMTYPTMVKFGVKTLDQGPSWAALKQAVIQPGGDVLQTAVAVAQIWITMKKAIVINAYTWEKWHESLIARLEQKVQVWEASDHGTDGECMYCHVKPFETLAFHCTECAQVYCEDHFDFDVNVCEGCAEEMPWCPSCDKKVHSLNYYCENHDDCVHAGELGVEDVEVCDECIVNVEWEGVSYVCKDCYQAQYKNKGAGGGRRGQTDHPAWEDRGITVKVADCEEYKREDQGVDDWKEVWGFDDKEHDPVQIAADFYLLHPLEHNSLSREVPTDLRVLSEEAAELRGHLIRTADDLFLKYCDMVCGGELRHHRAIGGRVVNAHRPVAWAGWREVRDKVGPQALLDAAALFDEMGGSYGGPNWAQVCEVLHLRETGKISPEVFVDRVFNLEHNGGAIISGKVRWKGFARWDQNAIRTYVGPAHAAHPARLDILAVFASSEALRIWADYLPVLNRLRRTHGQDPIARLPRRGQPNDAEKTWAMDISHANTFNTPIEVVRQARGGALGFTAVDQARRRLMELRQEGKLRSYAL